MHIVPALRARLRPFKKAVIRLIKRVMKQDEPKQWPTKSFDVWLILWVLLYRMQPKSIVEFGGGRSTNLLGEYACKMSAKLISFEQDRTFVAMIKRGLRISNLPTHYVVHAPIVGDWFDAELVEKHIPSTADCIFVDAPGGAVNAGRRDSEVGIRCIARIAAGGAILICDDTNRDEVDAALLRVLEQVGIEYTIASVQYAAIGTSFVASISICVPTTQEADLREALAILHSDVSWELMRWNASEGLCHK